MRIVYVYVLDTLADWETGYITAELNSGRFFRKGAPEVSVRTVSCSKGPIKTMGGFSVVPDCRIEDMIVDGGNVLILPGADTWNKLEHGAVIEKAGEFLLCGATVCAICGATVALAKAGVLDTRPHTSNGPGFLEMYVPEYHGKDFYVDSPSVADGNLITAGSTGALVWSKQILEHLDVFRPDALEYWYGYFSTGESSQFFGLLKALEADRK